MKQKYIANNEKVVLNNDIIVATTISKQYAILIADLLNKKLNEVNNGTN